MQNRDWYQRPMQNGGRTAHDYGHTHLPHDESFASRWGLPLTVLAAIVLWIAIGRMAVYLIWGN